VKHRPTETVIAEVGLHGRACFKVHVYYGLTNVGALAFWGRSRKWGGGGGKRAEGASVCSQSGQHVQICLQHPKGLLCVLQEGKTAAEVCCIAASRANMGNKIAIMAALKAAAPRVRQ
jgi:hypothetical protein